MPLNAKQQEATEYLAGPLLVLAGPGTGKTQLLAHKVAYILENTDASPENILCLTFTEAGVTAMRERLLSMRVASADRINISTYHSFGSQILAEYKNYAEHPSRALDQTINQVLQYKIVRSILDSLPATDILRSTDPAGTTKDLIETISEIKSARLTVDDLETIAKFNITEAETLNPLLNVHLQNLKPRMKFDDALSAVYLPIAETLSEHTSPTPIAGNITRAANDLLLSLQKIIEAEQAKDKPSVSPLTTWKNRHFEKDDSGNFRLSSRIANKKLLSLVAVYHEYDRILRETRQFDFSDMIEEAIRALKTDAGFKATLSERYQYVLLDEFQDTNASQFELVRLLTDYDQPSIMAVGDDDQAIFAFQGANTGNIINFANVYNAKIITLTENYRSTSEILDFGRKIADQIDDSFAKSRGTDKILTSARNTEIRNAPSNIASLVSHPNTVADPSTTFITRHEFPAADSEYAWVAQKVHELISAGVPQREIAIIAPKHKNISPLLPFLKSYPDIDISYEKRENVLEDEKIHELTLIARFVHTLSEQKNPSHLLPEILSFDFWELSSLELISAISTITSAKQTTSQTIELLTKSESEHIRIAANFLADLVAKSFTTPLPEFIRLIAEKITSAASTDKISLYENLAVLQENLNSYLNADRPRLKDFIDFLNDYEAASATILNTSPYSDSDNSISVLSAHKSKGLEFSHVFLISVDSISWGKAKGNNNRFTLPINLESIRHTGISADEQLRLLFVAATRAKLSLTMTSSSRNFAGQTPARLEYLQEYAVDDNSICSPLLPNTDVVEHAAEDSDADRVKNLDNLWFSRYLNLTPDAKATLKSRLENYRLSPSDLTTFIDIIHAGPLEFYKQKVLCAPREPATSQILLGNLIHSTFEQVTSAGLSDTDAKNFYESELQKLDISDQDAKDLKERGLAALDTSLTTFSDILRNPSAKAEVNLSHEHLTTSGIPITGKIDHININDTEKTIEIYDFKTGTFHDRKWDTHPSLYKYALQLGFYKLLLNSSPTYSKYTISRAHILFVSPDSDGLVHDKIYEFTPADEAALKDLIKKVYNHIKSLDFIDEDSSLQRYIHANENYTMKNVREFLEML